MKLQESYFSKMLNLKYGTPSADTLLRVFSIIDPKKFMHMFYHWICVLSTTQADQAQDSNGLGLMGKRSMRRQ